LLHDVVCEHQTQDYEVAFEIQNHHLPQRDHRLSMQTPEASVALPEIWEQSMRVPSFPYDTCAQRDHFVFKWFLTMFLSFAPEMSSDRERIFTNIFRIATVSRWNVSPVVMIRKWAGHNALGLLMKGTHNQSLLMTLSRMGPWRNPQRSQLIRGGNWPHPFSRMIWFHSQVLLQDQKETEKQAL
jgi:hypothetical protein